MRGVIEYRDSHDVDLRWVLHAREELHPFYGLNGFVKAPDMLWRERR